MCRKHCFSVAVELCLCLFAEPLPSNGCWIVIYLIVVHCIATGLHATVLFSHLQLGLPNALSFQLSHKNPTAFLFPHACYMLCLSHPPWLDCCNCTWQRVQVMKLLMIQFSQTSLLFQPSLVQLFSLAPSSQIPSVYVPTLMFCTHIQWQAKLYIVFYILIFMVLDSRWEDKRFWTEW
jgi:hypothetical protein